jgi:hypothetical protein
MVRPGPGLQARKQKKKKNKKLNRSNSKQLERKLAHKARISKKNYAKQRQTWRNTSKRCKARPVKGKWQRQKRPDLCYNTLGHGTPRKRSRRKCRNSHVNSPIVTFIEKLNGDEILEPRNALEFDLEDGRVDVSQVLGSIGVTHLQYECEPGVWRALKSNTSGKSVDTFQNDQHVLYRAAPKPNASSCHYGGLCQSPSISRFSLAVQLPRIMSNL